jgi:two-component sensor histidine kinase
MTFFQNILISGHVLNDNENLSKFRFILLNILLIIATSFAFFNFMLSRYDIIKLPNIYESVLLVYTILNFFAFLFLRKDRIFYTAVVYFILFIAFILFVTALIVSLDDNFRLIWFFILLLSYFVLIGKKYGLYFMLIIVCTILALYLNIDLNYNLLSMATFLNAFFVFTAFIYYFMNKIEKDEIEFRRLNNALELKVKKEITQRKEKELLLQEVHHRVKNNLQIILSMVQLQHNDKNQENQTNLLIDLENRINAIAKSYEMLISNDNLQEIVMDNYLKELLADMKGSFFHLGYDVKLVSNVDVVLPLKEAVFIGLITNEIITNSFKHAFPNKKGTISLSLTQKDNKYLLIIEDNGIGFIQNKSTSSLGEKLIHILVIKQLKGRLDIESEQQTRYRIQFTLQ